MANKYTISAVFKAVDKMSQPMNKMGKNTQKLSSKMQKNLGKANSVMSGIGSSLKTASIVAVGALAPIGFAMKDIIDIGSAFQQSMVNATAKFPNQIREGSDAYKRLQAVVMDVGRTTKFSSSQAAEGLGFLAMAGMNAEQSIAALPKMAQFAAASGLDLAEASDILTDSMGAMGLASKDPIKLAKNMDIAMDMMIKTANTANTDIPTMFEAIKESASTAVGTGQSLSDYSALLGVLANNGIKGGKAGTTLKNAFLRLAAPVGKGQKALKKLGIQTKDSEGNLRPVIDILGDINKATAKMGTGDRSKFLSEIFGKEAIAGVNILLAEGSEKLKKYSADLKNSQGLAKQLASVQTKTLKGSFDSLGSVIESVKLEIFNLNSGALKEIVDDLRMWVAQNGNLIAQNIGGFFKSIADNIDSIIFAIKGIAAVVGVFFSLSMAIKAVQIAVASYNGIMLAFSAATKAMTAVQWLFNIALNANPIGLIVIGVAALTAGIIALAAGIRKLLNLDFFGWGTKLKNNFPNFAKWVGIDPDAEGEAGTDVDGKKASKQMVSPESKLETALKADKGGNASKLEIFDTTGKAELSGNNSNITLEQSGAF